MTKLFKKGIVSIMAIAILSMALVFASGFIGESKKAYALGEVDNGGLAAIESQEYDTLENAVAAATAGDTIKLLANIDAATTVKIDKSLIIDLNGKTYNMEGSSVSETTAVFNVTNDASLTIKSTEDDKFGAISSSLGIAVVNNTNGAIIIEGGNIRTNSGIVSKGNGDIKVSGPKYEFESGSGVCITTEAKTNGNISIGMDMRCTDANLNSTNALIENKGNGNVLIKGNTLFAVSLSVLNNNGSGTVTIENAVIASLPGNIINNSGAGNIVITNATLTSDTGNIINNSGAGNIVITSATLTSGTGSAINNQGSGSISITGSTTKVESSNVNTEDGPKGTIYVAGKSEVAINAATISNTDSTSYAVYFAHDEILPNISTYLKNTSGTIGKVFPVKMEAEVDNVKYETFAEAIAAATAATAGPAGQTIKLLANIDAESTSVTILVPLTLDLNGFTYTYTGNYAAFNVGDDGNSVAKLTIANTGSADTGKINATNGNAIHNIGAGYITVNGGSVVSKGAAIHSAHTGGIMVYGGKVSSTGGVAIINDKTGVIDIKAATVEAVGFSAIENKGAGNVIVGTGGAVISNNVTAIVNSGTGAITVSGGTVSSKGYHAIINSTTGGIIKVSGGTVSAVGGFNAIYNQNNSVEISGGTVSAETGTAIYNIGSGSITVSGGTVSAKAGTAINNGQKGGVLLIEGTAVVSATGGVDLPTILNEGAGITINGGTVSAEAGIAIRSSKGDITVNGGTVSGESTQSTIYNTVGKITISGGAVTSINGSAINNQNGGKAIEISAGTVKATGTGKAIEQYSAEKITISGTETLITSKNNTVYENKLIGTTIQINSASVLEISGGTISNTATPTEGYSVYFGNASVTADNIDTYLIRNSGTVGKVFPAKPIVAAIGDVEYSSLKGAVEAATALPAGQTIKLLADIDGGAVSVEIGKSLTLDLNGFTYTFAGINQDGAFNVTYAADFAVEDGSTAKTGKIEVSNTDSVAINSDSTATGTITFKSGAIASGGTAIISKGAGKIVVAGGTITSTANGLSTTNGTSGTITVTGGVISATGLRSNAINNQSTGLLTINGGEIYSTGAGSAVFNGEAGNIVISGTATKVYSTGAGHGIYNVKTGSVTIEGGKVYSTTTGNGIHNLAGLLTIEGGEVYSEGAGSSVYNGGAGNIVISGTATKVHAKGTGKAIHNIGVGTITVNGGEVKAGGSYAIENTGSSDITVNGGTVSSASYITISNSANGGIITVSGGTVSGFGKFGNAIQNNGRSIIIKGGTVSSEAGIAINNTGSGSITVSGGTVSAGVGKAIHNVIGAITIKGTAEVSATGSLPTILNEGAAITIERGTITSVAGKAIENRGNGAITIAGGTVEAKGSANAIHHHKDGLVKISGDTTIVTSKNVSTIESGVIIGSTILLDGVSVLEISGGTISNTGTPTAGYAVYFSNARVTADNIDTYYKKTGTAVVNEKVHPAKPIVATIGANEFTSLAEAFDHANKNTGSIIKIESNITLPNAIIEITGTNVTLDLNGKTITSLVTGTNRAFKVNVGKTFIINDSISPAVGKITTNAGSDSSIVYNEGTFELLNATIHSENAYAIYNKAGTTTITNGSVTSNSTVLSTVFVSSGTITISGGEITKGSTTGSKYAVYFGNTNVNPGNLDTFLINNGGTVGKVFPLPYAAQIGETKYATFEEAVAAAVADDTIKLLRDVELSAGVILNPVVQTLDLNGKTITYTGTGTGTGTAITASKDLSITSSATDKGKIVSTTGSLITTTNNLSIEKTIIETSTGTAIDSSASISLSGSGVVKTDSGIGINSTTTSGDIIVTGTVSANTGIAIKNNATGEIQVSGTVTSANTDGTGGSIVQTGDLSSDPNKKVVTIKTGGTVENTSTGKAINFDASSKVTTDNILGHLEVESGSTLEGATSPALPAAMIGNKPYATFKEAVAAAVADDTIKLLRDVEFSAGVTLNDVAQTLDLNGKTITYTGTGTAITATNDLSITSSATDKGKIVSTTGSLINTTDDLSIEKTIIETSTGTAIDSSASVSLSGSGVVKTTTGIGINNAGTGTIEVSGTVSATTGIAINNTGTGTIEVSGTVSANTGIAIKNNATGEIQVSGTVTSANPDVDGGSIVQTGDLSSAADKKVVTIKTGGTVKNTTTTGNAINFDTSSSVTAGNILDHLEVESGANLGTTNPAIPVAMVGTTPFDTLQDAADAIKAGTVIGEIKLISNVFSSDVVLFLGEAENEIEIVIDLNGFNITYDGENGAIYNPFNNTLTLKDSSAAKNGKLIVTSTNGSAIRSTASKLNVEDITISVVDGDGIFFNSDKTLNITGATVSGRGGITIRSDKPGTVVIDGSKITSDTGVAIRNVAVGTITIKGDTEVKSGNTDSKSGTIRIEQVPDVAATDKVILKVEGGSVTNTAGGYAVYISAEGVTEDNSKDYISGSVGKVYPSKPAASGGGGNILSYDVVFNTNGGSSVETIKNVSRADKISAPEAPTKDGFVFAGWYADAEFTTEFDFANTYILSSTTIYAKWDAKTYSITFNVSGGTGTATTKEVVSGQKYGTLPTLTKEGYTFLGWYIGDTKITEDSLVEIDSNKTLEARFEKSGGGAIVPSPDGGEMSTFAIVGIVVGVLLAAGLIFFIILLKKRKKEEEEDENNSNK